MADAPDDRTKTHSATAAAADRPAPPPHTAVTNVRGRDRYQLIAEHGRGALGRVSRARDLELERDVAIKELITRTPLAEMRFFREALITARLEHPGIVPVHEAGRWTDGTPFYAMKLVAGRPLRALIAERSTVEDRLGLLHHVIAVADAIAYAHDRHIIHRDLKPANVIVGDFGETVVIDWGIAKDLSSASDDDAFGATPSTSPSADLTTTGSILGTPAYMAPEQARGEHVDQRADVFAIGAMLWELCALEKDPPRDPAVRHPVLRRARIDRDLVTIIDKALDEDPTRRYNNAGELAADLKAFKAGARIAARTYTLTSQLRRWIRRHRTRAIAIAVVVALDIAGSVLYAHNIAAEHAQTVAALAKSEEDKAALVLDRAELQMRTDPTAADATLRDYHGHDDLRSAMLRAEATGRGVARIAARPHVSEVWFLVQEPDGAVVSFDADHRVQRTTERGSQLVLSDLAGPVSFDYAPLRRLLIYTSSSGGIQLRDLATGATRALSEISAVSTAISADGSRVASLSAGGGIEAWDLGAALTSRYKATVVPDSYTWLRFIDHDTLFVANMTRSELHHIGTGTVTALPPGYTYAISQYDQLVAVGLADGTLEVFDGTASHIAASPVCRGVVRKLKIIPHRDRVAYTCGAGGGGIARYDLATRAIAVETRFDPREPMGQVAADPDGHYAAFGVDHTLYVYDLDTKITRRYVGQGGIISTVSAAPRAVVAGDQNGGIRVWDIQPAETRQIAQGPFGAFPDGLIISPDGTTAMMIGVEDPQLHVIEREATILLENEHVFMNDARFSDDAKRVIGGYTDGTAGIWDPVTGKQLRTLIAHHGDVVRADFLPGTRRMVTAGVDGQLLLWDDDARAPRPCMTHDHAWARLEVLRPSGVMIVADTRNAVWAVTPDCKATMLRPVLIDAITFLRASPDGHRLAIGRETGQLEIIDTASWHDVVTLQTSSGITSVAFHPTMPQLAVATHNGVVYRFTLESTARLSWDHVAIASRVVAYSPDGQTLAITTNTGGTWFYQLVTNAWRYTQDQSSEILQAQFTPDGTSFVTAAQISTLVARRTATLFPP